MSTETMKKREAIELVAGIFKSDEKWKAFDQFVDELVNKPEGISKKSVAKGLIVEAMGHEVENYKEETVNAVIETLPEDQKGYVDKRFKSIKSLISQAFNKPSKSKEGEGKKKIGPTIKLPNNTKVNPFTYEGFRDLMDYRLNELGLEQLFEIEGIVKEKIKNSKRGKELDDVRTTAHEKENNNVNAAC